MNSASIIPCHYYCVIIKCHTGIISYSFPTQNWRILARKLPILGNQSPRIGSVLARNLHFWGIKKEENSLNSLILVTISWRRKNIFFIKNFWWVFLLQKMKLNILGTRKLDIPRNVDFWWEISALMQFLARN